MTWSTICLALCSASGQTGASNVAPSRASTCPKNAEQNANLNLDWLSGHLCQKVQLEPLLHRVGSTHVVRF